MAIPFYSAAQVTSESGNVHLWIEGVPQPLLDGLTRLVHLQERKVDLGTLSVPTKPGGMGDHLDKFGNTYDPHSKSPYEP